MSFSSFLVGLLVETAYAQSNPFQPFCEPFVACGSGRLFLIEVAVRGGNLLFMAIGGVSVIAMVWACYGYVTSAFNDQKREGAKMSILFCLGGLILAIMGAAFVHTVKAVVEGLIGS